MQDLRIILIILGAMAIAALLIHGLWTSKKERQVPMRNKPLGKVASEPATDDDFDQDGIGRVRVISTAKPSAGAEEEDDEWRQTPPFSALDDDDAGHSQTQAAGLKPMPAAPAAGTDEPEEIDPLFDEPVRPAPADAAPVVGDEPQPLVSVDDQQAEQGTLAPEPVAEHAPVVEAPPVRPLREVPRTWQEVYVVNLMARPNRQIDGAALMRALTANGFHFGEMDIFHHHQTPAGQGEVLFSLINMVKPGTFNPEAMTDFSTPGVSIFMQLPRPGMAKNQFNLMVQTAENLAEELDALLFDAERAPLSPDYLAHCREQLRDYDSQAH